MNGLRSRPRRRPASGGNRENAVLRPRHKRAPPLLRRLWSSRRKKIRLTRRSALVVVFVIFFIRHVWLFYRLMDDNVNGTWFFEEELGGFL